MNQNTAFEIFFPEIDCNGKIYRKYSLIKAFIAEGGEYIETWTADGLETTNYAKKGDFIVQNLQTEYLESYIIDNITFFERYGLLYFSEYEAICFPKGKVKATIYYGEDTEFVAKWGRLMSLKTGDYIVSPCPKLNEVYRIARKEFLETYEEDL